MRHRRADATKALCVVACVLVGMAAAARGDEAAPAAATGPAAAAASQPAAAASQPAAAASQPAAAVSGKKAIRIPRGTPPPDGKPVRPGELLEVKIAGVAGGGKVAIHFENVKSAGWVAPAVDSPATVPGVTFTGSDLNFAAAGSGAAGRPNELTFVAGIVVSGSIKGTVMAGNGVTVVLRTPFGTAASHGGPFDIVLNTPPDTCYYVGTCFSRNPCHENRIGEDCYIFDNQSMCCLVCPTGC